jgi:hypothetical protein
MDTDQLYGLPLESFVAGRTALVKELRAAGKRNEAAEAAALRKPSVAAWAVNQLVRTQRKAFAALLAAGDALQTAQADVLSGRGDPGAVRAALEEERAEVDALVDRAQGLLSSQGQELSAGMLERVADTLHAAALDDEARALVQDGRLERELKHVGLGIGGGLPALAPTPAERSKPPKPAARKPPAEPAAKAERERARAEDERRAEARRRAKLTAADARRRAEVAKKALVAAERRRDSAAAALSDAEAALARTEADATAAAEALRAAEDALARTRRS